MFQLRELLQWFGLTVFEIWTALLCFTVFTVLLALRVENIISEEGLSWWNVFLPLFVSDALNAYFCVIVFIRTYLEGAYKPAFIRALWSLFMISLLFVFKYLLCKKLSVGIEAKLEFSEVMTPVFILLQLVMIRACKLY